MKNLRDLTVEELGGGLNVIDLGASGTVKREWRPIAGRLNVLGFDPNREECARLNAQQTGYLKAQFLPYALAGETGPHTLYQTKSIYCWSLLRPRLDEWLSRFTYCANFELTGTSTIQAYRLDEVPELADLQIDAMKIDTQGLELPILRTAQRFVDSCACIETESGFTQNYEGETTFDQLAVHLDAQGFGLFGIDPYHAISRRNVLSRTTQNEQLLWCEAIWLRDYLRLPSERQKLLTREAALRALCLFANHGCIAFGLEAAGLFRDLGLFSGAELDVMSRADWWRLPGRSSAGHELLATLLNYVPRGMLGAVRRRLFGVVGIMDNVAMTPHPLKRR